jgi:hypothetical protein
MLHTIRKGSLFILMAVLFATVLPTFAQEDETPDPAQPVTEIADPMVTYNGVEMKNSELLKDRTSPIYCSLIIDDAVVARGYWDGRYDRKACFDTDAEALAHSEANPSMPVTDKLVPDSPLKPDGGSTMRQQGCANTDRGTGYVGVLYAGAYSDVCANHVQTYIGGTGGIQSIWLENPVADTVCPRIYIRENYFPPAYSYVDYSTAFISFIYVAWYNWAPKSC